jgi:hypothetical protein
MKAGGIFQFGELQMDARARPLRRLSRSPRSTPILISTLDCRGGTSAMTCCAGFFMGNSLSPRRAGSSPFVGTNPTDLPVIQLPPWFRWGHCFGPKCGVKKLRFHNRRSGGRVLPNPLQEVVRHDGRLLDDAFFLDAGHEPDELGHAPGERSGAPRSRAKDKA